MTVQQLQRKSKKTSIFGTIGSIGLLVAILARCFDGDPSTTPDLAATVSALHDVLSYFEVGGSLVGAVAIAAAFLSARDHDVSSKEAGVGSEAILRVDPAFLLPDGSVRLLKPDAEELRDDTREG